MSWSPCCRRRRRRSPGTDFWKDLRERNEVLIDRALQIYNQDAEGILTPDTEFSRDELTMMVIDFIRAVPELQRHLLRVGRTLYHLAVFGMANSDAVKCYQSSRVLICHCVALKTEDSVCASV